MTKTNKPNIFNYATSELSQDAFICWLLSWADNKYQQTDTSLYETGVMFIDKLFEIAKTPKPNSYDSIKVEKQVKNIDVLLTINGHFIFIIEDKTFTKDHSNQLERYLDNIKSKDHSFTVIPIYFKTGDQCLSSYKTIEDVSGYSVFKRKDFLTILKHGNTFGIENNIFNDYSDYLQSIENNVNSYQKLKLDEWKHSGTQENAPWIGFFKELEKELDDSEWDYVPNQSGGFLGFWWHEKKWQGLNVYLQLEFEKICFRIEVKDPSKQTQARNAWHDALKEASENSTLTICKPQRFGKGVWMTSAILCDDDYRASDVDEIIDIQKTIKLLREAEKLLDLAVQR